MPDRIINLIKQGKRFLLEETKNVDQKYELKQNQGQKQSVKPSH